MLISRGTAPEQSVYLENDLTNLYEMDLCYKSGKF